MQVRTLNKINNWLIAFLCDEKNMNWSDGRKNVVGVKKSKKKVSMEKIQPEIG